MSSFKGIKVKVISQSGVTEHVVKLETFVLGAQDDADLKLKINGLSRKHLKVKYENGKIFIKDIGSTFGSVLNEEKIKIKKYYECRPADQVLLGAGEQVVQFELLSDGIQQEKVDKSADNRASEVTEDDEDALTEDFALDFNKEESQVTEQASLLSEVTEPDSRMVLEDDEEYDHLSFIADEQQAHQRKIEFEEDSQSKKKSVLDPFVEINWKRKIRGYRDQAALEEKNMVRVMVKKENLERDLDNIQQIRSEMIGEIKLLEKEKGQRLKNLSIQQEESENIQAEIYRLNDDMENLKEKLIIEKKGLFDLQQDLASKSEDLEQEFNEKKHQLNLQISEIENELESKQNEVSDLFKKYEELQEFCNESVEKRKSEEDKAISIKEEAHAILEGAKSKEKEILESIEALKLEINEKSNQVEDLEAALEDLSELNKSKVAEHKALMDSLQNESSEITNQLNQLNQKKKSLLDLIEKENEKYDLLKSKIEADDSEYVQRLKSYKEEVESLEARKKEAITITAELKTTIEELNESKRHLSSEIDQKNIDFKQLKESIDFNKSEEEKVKKTLIELKEKENLLKTQVEEIESRYKLKDDEVKRMEKLYSELERKIESEGNAKRAQINNELEGLNNKLGKLKTQIKESDDLILKKKQEFLEVEESIKKSLERHAMQEQKIDQAKQYLHQEEEKLSDLKNKIDQRKNALEDLSVEFRLKEKDLSVINEDILRIKTEAEKMAEEIVDQAHENSKKELKKLEADLKQEQERHKLVLLEEKQKQLDDIEKHRASVLENLKNQENQILDKAQSVLDEKTKRGNEIVTAAESQAAEIIASSENISAEKLKKVDALYSAEVERAKAESDRILTLARESEEGMDQKAKDKLDQTLREIEDEAQKRRDELELQFEERKKEQERIINELKVIADEEISHKKMQSEMDQKKQKKHEVVAIRKNIEAAINGKLSQISGDISSGHYEDITKEINDIVSKVLDKDYVNEGREKRNLFFSADEFTRQKEKKWWLWFAAKSILAGGLGILLLTNLWVVPAAFKAVYGAITTNQSASDIFLSEHIKAINSRPKFSPVQDDKFKDNYTDNIIYTSGYREKMTDEDGYKKRWINELNAFFVDDLELEHNLIVDFITIENNLVQSLIYKRDQIKLDRSEKQISEMRNLENEKVDELKKMLKSPMNYKKFVEFRSLFWEKDKMERLPSNKEEDKNSLLKPKDVAGESGEATKDDKHSSKIEEIKPDINKESNSQGAEDELGADEDL
ncbi:MAG: FHA domain-containing protein [Bdellovibrionales bacterium]|nr:FHA domain-containing protein [Bdellovibrionales bacterium]